MLIYLLPADPYPRLYHTVDFMDPFERVPVPAGWAAQLHVLHTDELDLPNTMHALDKASWLTAVIEELVFDLVSRTVSCTFVGGPSVQWPMAAQGSCVQVLESALGDLVQSQAELARERTAAAPKLETQAEALSQPVSVKPTKHKKQRSLLSSLFSGLNKLSLNTGPDCPSSPSPSPTRMAFSPPSSPSSSPPSRPSTISWKPAATFLPLPKKSPLPQPPPRPLSAVLQARARSVLVDAFRRFVVSELKARFELGPGYTSWAIRNMIRRTEDHMAWLVHEAGGVVPNLMDTMPPRSRSLTASDMSGTTLVSVTEAPFYEDDEDEEDGDRRSLSTETDGSSVHTPLDSHSTSPFVHGNFSSVDVHRPVQHIPRSPSPPEFSPEDLATYTALSAQCVRLSQLLTRLHATRANAVHDERNFLAVLEVKSRRRAWSNRAFLGGAMMEGVGLATPFRSSPLARCEPITPEYLDARMLEVTTGEHNISTLFPLSEEEEEEDTPAVRFVQDDALRDLESGLLPPLQRPPMRPRTHSMHPLHHGLDMDLSADPETPRIVVPPPPPMHVSLPMPPPQQTLAPTALLFQPLKRPMLESQTKFDLFDDPEDDVDDGVRVAPEFTLSMDLPPPYAKTSGHDGWLGAPRLVR